MSQRLHVSRLCVHLAFWYHYGFGMQSHCILCLFAQALLLLRCFHIMRRNLLAFILGSRIKVAIMKCVLNIWDFKLGDWVRLLYLILFIYVHFILLIALEVVSNLVFLAIPYICDGQYYMCMPYAHFDSFHHAHTAHENLRAFHD